ncbi:MAG: glycoside hydrolase family 2 TIM barrel-domain containing protein, partial [Bacteroidota bacterium]
MLRTFLIFLLLFPFFCFTQSTQKIYLSGKDKDDTVDWEFRCSEGRNSGKWSTIPVPSHWEQHGFGSYNYGREKKEQHSTERGEYRYRFTPSASLTGKHLNLVFDGVMTDATVRLNGQSVGPTHQGAFYRFRYDVTNLLKLGEENLLEVDVAKVSANASVNQAERHADYWIFGGIFRPVWLEVLPEQHIRQLSVDAQFDGALSLSVDLVATNADKLKIIVTDPETGEKVATATSAIRDTKKPKLVKMSLGGILPWSAESPKRYSLRVELLADGNTLHEVTQKIGFRTVEVRPQDGIYVNYVKIKFRGVNRHCFWPESGRTLSKQIDIDDAVLIKSMNMNAVRMSHYPPDPTFLDAADSLGLYIIDELAGWQEAYDTEAGTPLVKEMIERDVNHPSIILWSNGNEGGHNHELLPLYDQYDPQKRTVIHPWGVINNTDTKHYRPFDCCAGRQFHGTEIFFPTEMQHGMYDGGHGASLDELWEAMYEHPLSAGGFLWNLADEGIVRTDKDGFIDTHGNMGADGILGPHREKEGSFYTIREIWSPVHIEQHPLVFGDKGRVKVENRFHRTNLDKIRFVRSLVKYPAPSSQTETIRLSDTLNSIRLEPGLSAYLSLQLPADWETYDAADLQAYDTNNKLIMEWTFPIRKPAAIAEAHVLEMLPINTPKVTESKDELSVVISDLTLRFSRTTGLLASVTKAGQQLPLSDGPFLDSDSTVQLQDLSWRETGDGLVVTAKYNNSLRKVEWTIYPTGIVSLDYAYVPFEVSKYGTAKVDYIGLHFTAGEEQLAGIDYLGAGPYRVYKNRTKGTRLGFHEKPYNDA